MNENHDRLIQKFPPEIASLIFIQYSPPSESFDNLESPLHLGAVCQKWRQLAWATPELWTALRIGSPGNINDLPQLVTEWLERSASLPLTIKLENYWGWADGGNDSEVINILNKHSARWHDIHFDLPARHLHRLYGSSQGNILRRLVLRQCPRAQAEPSDFPTFSMKSKPSPTDLTLLTVDLPYVDIVWNNLTVASVDDIGVDQCVELIRRAPLLNTLTLQRIKHSSDVFLIPNTRIVHPHLHSLELRAIKEETVVAGILDSLCLPSLEKWNHNQSSFPPDNMLSFAGCLSSCLKTFNISVEWVEYHQLTRFLSHLSSLEFLALRAGSIDGKLLSLLCASAQSPLYLPHLQCLEVSGFNFPWKSLPQMFPPASRWKSFKLRVRVNDRLHHLYDLGDEPVKILMELVDKGIDLSIVNDRQIDLLQAYREEWLHKRTSIQDDIPPRASSTSFT
jgi:hypothetical protein